MKEYELLRIELLKTLLQMEEKLLVIVENGSNQSFDTAVGSPEKISLHKNDIPGKAVLSVSELSEFLGVSTDCIYTMVREDQIPYVRIRRRIFFYKETINSWIQTNTSKICD
jgi:excisionase family DNA binding protein